VTEPLIGTDVPRAARLLREGKLVALPTETVYGLAANALDSSAIAGIFEAKNRPEFDPLIVHTHSFDEFRRFAESIPADATRLAEALCPGPITFILPKHAIIPDIVTAGLPTVGLRVPDHPVALELLRTVKFPLAAPSANPFGYVSPTTARHVADQLGDHVAYILDGGPSRVGIESTIIDFARAKPRILRLGGVSLEKLEEMLGHKLDVQLSSSRPSAPGMLLAHYAPAKPVRVGDIDALLAEHATERVGVLAFSSLREGVDLSRQRVLSPAGDLREAATNLFGHLRELDAMPVDVVLAEWVPDDGLGRAINDRLRRAAASATTDHKAR
jgi:L-threonylcarbamoyladenylate synthase